MSADERDRQAPRLDEDEGRADAGPRQRQPRDSADIAQLLRALNDDLRDDTPRPTREAGRGFKAAATSDDAADDTHFHAGPRPGFIEADDEEPSPVNAPPLPSRSRPPTALVAFGLLAVAAMGLAAVVVTGGSKTTPGDAITPLIVASPSAGAGAASGGPPAPSVVATSPVSPSVNIPTVNTSAPTVAATPASPFPPAPMVALPGGTGAAGTTGRTIDPSEGTVSVLPPKGPTTTVVRPMPEPAGTGGATVLVSPAPAPSAPAQPAAPIPVPGRQPRPLTAPQSATIAATPAPSVPVRPSSSVPAASSAVPAVPAGGPGHYAVQVGSYSVAANADAEVQRLNRQGWRAYAVDWEDSHQRKWRAVRIGNYPNDAAARKAQADIKSRLSLSGQIVNLR